MVHEKVRGIASKSPTSSSPTKLSARRSSSRYQPTARKPPITKPTTQNLNPALWSTIYTLNLPEQSQLDQVVNGSVCPEYVKNATTCTRSRSEKLVFDKVEDMDIDHPSDGEESSLDSELPGTSGASGLQISSQVTQETVGKTKAGRRTKQEPEEDCKQDKLQPSLKEKKNTSLSGISHGQKPIKKKPIYIILHAALVRVGGITGKALSPIRIQAERILVQMEVKSGSTAETFTLRIPCKELVTVQANLSEPPYLLVAFINQDYSHSLLNGSKKNGVLCKMKGINELDMVIQLTYDSIPKDVKQDLDMFRGSLSTDVRWKEISSSEAAEILNGKSAQDATDAPKEKEIPSQEERKILTGRGNRKKNKNIIQETRKEDTSEPTTVKIEKENSPVSREKAIVVNDESNGSSIGSNDIPSEDVLNCRRKRTYDETTESTPESNCIDLQEGTEVKEPEEDKNSKDEGQHCQVVPESNQNKATQNQENDNFRFIQSQERSFEENRQDARRIGELEVVIAEKEGILNQQRITVELRELQLEQERNTIRELRGTLREEQNTRRDLEARYEAINSQLLVRNSRDLLEKSNVDEMQRELARLNISLNEVRTENRRLVEGLHDMRSRLAEGEEALNTERSTITTLREDLGRERSALEDLRGDLRRKNDELKREQNMRAEAVERRNHVERSLTSSTQEYEERLRRSDEERTMLRRQYDECNRTLETTRDEMQATDCALRRAQETIEEYTRMQPRDWTILRDELEISEKILGQGAWGWVKEGTFRRTKVAVKQMHELIVSPHNRRLFEREMHMAARCRHPNLLQFIGATNDNGLALLVTELLETNLRSLLGQRALSHDEVLTLCFDVSRALNYLHLNKPFPIIHRDISSTNVLLWKREDTWHAKLSDYGAANFMRQCMTVSPGASIYAAPEVLTSQQSTKVDVFSFGLLLCEMCIRELPVPDHTNDQIRLITNGHLRDLVRRCTNTTPDNRPTMHDVLSALEHLSSNATLGMVSVNSRQVTL